MKKSFNLQKRIIAIISKLEKWNQSIVGWCKEKWSRICSIKIPWKGLLNSIVQIGTIVATVVAIYALRETRLQRESTYKPVIFIEKSHFLVKRGEMRNYEYYVEQDDSLVRILKQPYFRLLNVGMGCAFNVVTHMHLNSDTIVSFLAEEGFNDVQEIRDNYTTSIIVNKQDTLTFFGAEHLINDMTSYVLPVNQSTDSFVQYFIPGVSGMILDVVRYVDQKKGKPGYGLCFPIDVDYKDINGKLYSYTFLMDMTYTPINDGFISCYVSSRLTNEDHLQNVFNYQEKKGLRP